MSQYPKLRTDLVLIEQTYRGEQSFILKDPESRKYFRFRPLEVRVMQVLDGGHTPAAAAEALQAQGLLLSAAVIDKFAAKLSGMGLCERTLGERSVLLMERLRAERHRRLGNGIFQGDMLRLRWSVGDPDKMLDRWLPRMRFFFTPTFLAISVALFAAYFLVVALKWSDFSHALADLYTLKLGLSDLVVLWLTGTVIIAIHELGHGFTCKYFGGHVHEIGAMLIYFEPAFFCNVNDAWTFPERRARLWVTAAGSWIQFAIAGVAAVIWWAATPGTLVSDVAFAAVLIGGVTTVLMNVNPLIPLDGYYALSDYLEVPNLRQRAAARLGWLIQTRVFRLDAAEPAADERERRIFVIYGALSAAYIGMILLLGAVNSYGWLSRTLGTLGVLIFLLGATMVIRRQFKGWGRTAVLALRQYWSKLTSSRLRTRLLAAATGILLLGIVVPWPITISGPFTVAPGSLAVLTAPDSGIVARVNVQEGSLVTPGAPVLELRNLDLERRRLDVRRLTDSLSVAATRARAAERISELAELEAWRTVESARLAGLEQQVRALAVRAITSGQVLTSRPEELVGRRVFRGEHLLTVGQPDSVELRITLRGAGVGAVASGLPVRVLPTALDSSFSSTVTQVSAAAGPSHAVEGRVRLSAGPVWHPGMTGTARIRIRQSNLWGAFWWEVRRTIRSDILL